MDKCPVCSLTNGHHDIRKHRLATSPVAQSMSRHPAGKRRKPAESEGNSND